MHAVAMRVVFALVLGLLSPARDPQRVPVACCRSLRRLMLALSLLWCVNENPENPESERTQPKILSYMITNTQYQRLAI
jgi:hypothetical protein